MTCERRTDFYADILAQFPCRHDRLTMTSGPFGRLRIRPVPGGSSSRLSCRLTPPWIEQTVAAESACVLPMDFGRIGSVVACRRSCSSHLHVMLTTMYDSMQPWLWALSRLGLPTVGRNKQNRDLGASYYNYGISIIHPLCPILQFQTVCLSSIAYLLFYTLLKPPVETAIGRAQGPARGPLHDLLQSVVVQFRQSWSSKVSLC